MHCFNTFPSNKIQLFIVEMYGMGCYFLQDRLGKILRWGHTGEEDGVSCRAFYYPGQELDVVVLGNQSWCAGKVMRKLDDLFLG